MNMRDEKRGCCKCVHAETPVFREPCRSCLMRSAAEAVAEEIKQPSILPRVAVLKHGEEKGRAPELIRLSFSDGSTAVYQLKGDQAEELMLESVEIIRKWGRQRRRRDRRA